MEKKRIVLASASPRRKELLLQIGIEPEIVVSHVKERLTTADPREAAMSLAAQKARAVAAELRGIDPDTAGSGVPVPEAGDVSRAASVPEAGDVLRAASVPESGDASRKIPADGPEIIVIGSDTVVSVAGRILGKPKSHEEAREMISLLSGRTHEVYTGVCVIHCGKQGMRETLTADRTEVTVEELTEAEIREYADSEEPMDKAGAYAVQGFFARYIRSLNGSYANVMGLPVHIVYRILKEIV